MTAGVEDQPFDPRNGSSATVKLWLKTALDGYFDDDSGRWAFSPLELEIGRQADLAHDLKDIYDSLPAVAKSRWRSAVTDLLAEQGNDPERQEAAGVLIDLAVFMPAFTVLEVLPSVVANAGAPEAAQLYDRAVAAATALSCRTEAARDCLERLRTSPGFSPAYAGLIFIALCRVDPDRWPDHLRNMKPALRSLVKKLGPDSAALRWYAEDFLCAVTLAGLCRALGAFPEHGEPTADWLWNQLFEGGSSLIVLDEAGNLVLREAANVSFPLVDTCRAVPTKPPEDPSVSSLSTGWLSAFQGESETIQSIARTIGERNWMPEIRAGT